MCLAVPMKITQLVPPDKAIVESEGVSTEVSTALLEDATVGDYVIIHTGFALEKLDLEEAEKTLGLLRELAESNKGMMSDE